MVMNLFPRKVEFMALFLCLFAMPLLPQTCYSFESKTLIKNQLYEAEFMISEKLDFDGDILVIKTLPKDSSGNAPEASGISGISY